MANPVHCEDGKWYFYIETWHDREGPFETEEEASNACSEYARSLDAPNPVSIIIEGFNSLSKADQELLMQLLKDRFGNEWRND